MRGIKERKIMAKKNNPIALSCLNEDDLIVIAGAGGFIAGALARYFREQGFTRIPKTCSSAFHIKVRIKS